VAWAADGKSWFAESRIGDSHALIHIDASGTERVLRQVKGNTWGVASPDGRKLAFVDYTPESNVWIWRQPGASR
jgi:Tol biopolymer transport system component